MPIINNQNINDVDQFVASHKRRVSNFFRQTLSGFKQLGREFWENPTFTPMEIAQAYGTEAVELFTLSSQMQTFLESLEGSPIPVVPEGYTVTPHQDGTVTVTPPEPDPEPTVPDNNEGN